MTSKPQQEILPVVVHSNVNVAVAQLGYVCAAAHIVVVFMTPEGKISEKCKFVFDKIPAKPNQASPF